MHASEEQQEKKAKRTGLIVAIGLHAVLALLFLFLIAWREPNPPLPEYGFELLGLDAEGGGDLEQTQPAQEQPEPLDDAAPEEPVETSQPEEVTEPEVEEAAPEPVEEAVEEPVEEANITEAESPDVREEVKPEPKKVEEPKPVKKEEATKPAETTKTNEEAPKKSGNEAESGTSSSETGSKPSIDDRGLYKGPSKGPGSSTSGDFEGGSYEGFDGFGVPDFTYVDEEQEFGTMKFKITLDEYGYVKNVQTVRSDFRPEIRIKYERFLRSLKFDPKSNKLPGATGTVTYVIKAK